MRCQPYETAVVRKIEVADGEHVQAGQPLILLDAVSAAADRDKASGDQIKTEIEIARLEGLRRFIAGQAPELADPPAAGAPAEIEAARAAMNAQAAEQEAKLGSLDKQIAEKTAEAAEAAANIDRFKAALPVATQQEALHHKLEEEGYGTTFEWMTAKEHLIEVQYGLPAAIQHRDQALASIDALKRQSAQARAEFEKSVLSDLASARLR
jgi:hemolysin D